ncbi:endonuclease III domain-containing protein [Lacticaseibacillus hulanensis]|uniref:endonuclease III domain-containing protein n=1 Tax=Lacticaseibacillus hulanensis TaxID=2493111 RepID=UPI000FDC186B|nr:endonuclease III [Lacticaseibacillus hulanensis]
METITIDELYQTLYKNLGPRHWWPARSTEELICGMILVQNTNYKNVFKSLANLDAATNFGIDALLNLPEAKLQELIMPSGFYKNKSRYLRVVLTEYRNHYHQLAALDTASLRARLRSLPGVGNETADVLLLYVFMRPAFVADSYTRRLFRLIRKQDANYEQLQRAIVPAMHQRIQEAQEFHALLDDYGKLGSDVLDLGNRYRLDV